MTPLEQLLMRVRDGDTRADLLEEARVLLREEVRLPAELRTGEDLIEDPRGTAEALLSVLGCDDGWLRGLLGEALRDEAASEPVIDENLLSEMSWEVPVAEAVAFEAQTFSFDGGELFGAPVSSVFRAIAYEAGTIEIVRAVCDSLEIPVLPVASAVAFEAGSVDAVVHLPFLSGSPEVREALGAEAGSVDIADAVLAALRPSSLGGPVVVPGPAANTSRLWGFASIILVAAAMLVVVGRFAPWSTMSGVIDLPDFASLAEVRVEDLSYGQRANAAVIPFEDNEGHEVLVIWVEEESGV